MDRSDPPDPAAAGGRPADLRPLLEIMARLRGPDGCPWDRAQTHESLLPWLLEEAYEFIDAAGTGDPSKMAEELGDLLLQIAFHAQLGAERGAFDMQAAIEAICAKMIRRHPHVFGGESVADAEAVGRRWREIKQAEGRGVLDGVPRGLPALARAYRLGERAAGVGFDWTDVESVQRKVDEERGEVEEARRSGDRAALEREVGDLLLATANLARMLGVEPEGALRGANDRFERRFGHVEARVQASGGDWGAHGADRLDAWWREAKSAELTRPEPTPTRLGSASED